MSLLKIIFVLSLSISAPSKNTKSPGIIVSFKNWPTTKQKEKLLKIMKDAGLKKKLELKIITAWSFLWPEAREIKKSNQICKKVELLSFVKYCEADQFVSGSTLKNKR